MTGRVSETWDGMGGWMHFERPWPEEERCDWCFAERYHNRAELRVGELKLCLSCWFLLAFGGER